MSKDLIKKSICGILLGCIMASSVGIVNAEVGSTSKSVKVGNVETGVYSYEIDMDDVGLYDWVYEEAYGRFIFEDACKAYTYEDGINSMNDTYTQYINSTYTYTMYSDSKCSARVDSPSAGDTVYMRKANKLVITDDSQYGQISAEVEYIPTDSYNWTFMQINNPYYVCKEESIDTSSSYVIDTYYSDSNCSTKYASGYSFNSNYDKVYEYSVSTHRNVAYTIPLKTLSKLQNVSRSLDLYFSDPGQYNINIYENGAEYTLKSFDKRTAEVQFDFFNYSDFLEQAFENGYPVSGDTLGTITVTIHEDV